MATAVFSTTDLRGDSRLQADDRHGWGFALLLVVTATLFVRPADIFPAMEFWPIYQFLMVACLLVALRTVVRHLDPKRLSTRPVTVCLLILLAAVVASHLAHGYVWGARTSMWEFCKLAAYYLLVAGLINSERRLLVFSQCLVIAITLIAALALLDRSEIVSIAAFESIRDHASTSAVGDGFVDRIRGTGIFRDPNDFGLILVTGLVLSVGLLLRPRIGLVRHIWIIPIALLVLALTMTHSRGAFLSLACAIPAGVAYRRGIGLAFASLIGLPLLAVLFSGRMTDLGSIQTGTGQSRIKIWSESLTVWVQNPLFGIGEGRLVEELNAVAHNSFIHCFAELGLFGGTAFVACFLAAGLGLWSLRERQVDSVDDRSLALNEGELKHMQVYVFALLAAYAGGLVALSRHWVTPTYLVLGLATATQMIDRRPTLSLNFGNRLIAVSITVSAASLVGFYVLVRLLVNW